MKFASLMHGRDGRFVVVSRDLTRATDAFPVVPTLQAALDDWARHAPRLSDLAEALEHGSVPSFRFHEHDCAAPLPRAFQRLGVAGGQGVASAPLEQLSSDGPAGPRQPARAAGEDDGIDVEAGAAVVTGDVPEGVPPGEAAARIRLVMLVGDLRLRRWEDGDDLLSRPGFCCSPVAVTPDELGEGWREGRLALPLLASMNGVPVTGGPASASVDFGALVAHAAAGRALAAGTIIGARTVPTLCPEASGAVRLRFGDTVRIEMRDGAGRAALGAIEREILPRG